MQKLLQNLRRQSSKGLGKGLLPEKQTKEIDPKEKPIKEIPNQHGNESQQKIIPSNKILKTQSVTNDHYGKEPQPKDLLVTKKESNQTESTKKLVSAQYREFKKGREKIYFSKDPFCSKLQILFKIKQQWDSYEKEKKEKQFNAENKKAENQTNDIKKTLDDLSKENMQLQQRQTNEGQHQLHRNVNNTIAHFNKDVKHHNTSKQDHWSSRPPRSQNSTWTYV